MFVKSGKTGEFTRFNFWPKDIKEAPMYHHVHGLSYTASGYGRKIPTRYMVNLCNRWHRVYCAIFSNIGSVYIISRGERFLVDLNFEANE